MVCLQFILLKLFSDTEVCNDICSDLDLFHIFFLFSLLHLGGLNNHSFDESVLRVYILVLD